MTVDWDVKPQPKQTKKLNTSIYSFDGMAKTALDLPLNIKVSRGVPNIFAYAFCYYPNMPLMSDEGIFEICFN